MNARIRTKTVLIEGISKRLSPTKHYVYVMRVEMSNSSSHKIFRRYKQFLMLQIKLYGLFPKESGGENKEHRIIPFIPGKAASGKNHLRSTAIERISHLELFCQKLIGLPEHISQCLLVKEFFARNSNDDVILSPTEMTSAKNGSPPRSEKVKDEEFRVREDFIPGANAKRQIPLRKNETVEVLEKLETGWWYVQAESGIGFVPGAFLEDATGKFDYDAKVYSSAGATGKPYVVTKCYKAAKGDELSIRQGMEVTVLEKRNDGWWMAEYKGDRGLVPGCYLVRRHAARGIRIVSQLQHQPHLTQKQPQDTKENHEKPVKPLTHSTSAAKSKPKPLRIEATYEVCGLTSPPTTPVSTNQPGPGVSLPVDKEGSTVESSSDSDESYSEPSPPPPRFSLKPGKPVPLPKPNTTAIEKKIYRARKNYESTTLGTMSLEKGQEVQVMTQRDDNGWIEVKVQRKKGYVPRECIEETKITSPRTRKKSREEDLGDFKEALWSEDALKGERVLQNLKLAGTFMIRKSSTKENQETLVVIAETNLLKYKIHQNEDGRYSVSKNSQSFLSLHDLLSFYCAHELPKSKVTLKTPYKRLIPSHPSKTAL